MHNIPTAFADKLDLSVRYSKAEIRFTANAAFARLACISAKRDLHYAIANDFPEAYITLAQEVYDEKRYLEYEYERQAEDRGPDICFWSSGYHFDDNGNEVWATVDFDPLTFDFIATRHNENGSYPVGSAQTFEEAEDIACCALFGDDDEHQEKRLTPTIPPEESYLAGQAIVKHNGRPSSVEVLVNDILVRANAGCGLHYEIFAKRAASMLASLPGQLTGADLENVEKYLEYDRY